MAKGPAVVVVARHGARLDAADKTWHLTSPTPYDPPLTYNGWSQAKALGLRIAALLHQRDNEQLEADKDADLALTDLSKPDGPQTDKARRDTLPRPRKRRKIVIHSSPYLRCVQTSTAVAAGISQFQPPATPTLKAPIPSNAKGAADKPSTKSTPTSTSSTRPSKLRPLVNPNLEVFPRAQNGPEKILLRIDAFLGEWLSPDYFEDITPPPNSTMMVAGAKADLLRRGDYIQEMTSTSTSKGFFPGGWVGKSAATPASQAPEKSSLASMGSLASVSPFRERSSSQGSSSLERTRSRENVAALAPPVQRASSRTYEPPVPTYSVAGMDPIPRGYFAHAREACISVDFQWDSMRPPQEWGDGGEYGDEWSTMHKRFRRGLAGMMQWYREHGATPPKDPISGFMFKAPLRLTPMPASKRPSEQFPSINGESEVDDDEELVLVLLTHGAGCNALLGAIMNQPVLVDVGLASLSMAVRRKEPRKASEPTILDRRLSVADPEMSETYEMKLMASVDHLKPGVDPSRLQGPSQVSSPAVAASPSLESRRRFTGSSGASSPLDSPFTIGEPFRTWNSSLGSTRRTMSSGSNKSYMQSNLNPSGNSTPATGLWSSPKLTPLTGSGSSDGRSSPGADMVANFNTHSKPKVVAPGTLDGTSTSIPPMDGDTDIINALSKLNTNEEKEAHDSVAPLSKPHHKQNSTQPSLWGAKPQPKSNAGLWGPPRLDDVYEHRKGPTPKRRWTVSEREESLQ